MIELVPYDPTWPARFDEEAARLQAVCGALALRIDHVGSTSIPGIAAKLVIDVQITVGVLEPLREWQDRLARLGYSYLPRGMMTSTRSSTAPRSGRTRDHVALVPIGERDRPRHPRASRLSA